jgi:hypothetical protein
LNVHNAMLCWTYSSTGLIVATLSIKDSNEVWRLL